MQITIFTFQISRRARPAFGCVFACALLLATPLSLNAADKANSYLGPVVTVTKAKKTCLSDSIDITGTLVAKNEIVVRPEQEGYQISKVLVEVGDTVTSGQALARLTPPEGQSGGSVAVESPGAGVIGKATAVVGALTSLRAPPLFEIIGNGEIELLADVPTKVIGRLSPGQPAKITIVGIGILPGRVRVASPIVNAATQLGSARIFIGKDKQLRIGTFGRASIVAGESCNVVVPLSAVLYSSVGAIVEVVHDSKVETRKVVLGLLSGGLVEIREGLSEGDMVASRAGAFLREGDHVRPVIGDASADKN